MILKKLHASTGNRTRNNSLEGCYANHYTIDALGDLLIFEAINYIFKSKIQIQKELASSGKQTRAARVEGEHSTTELRSLKDKVWTKRVYYLQNIVLQGPP